MNIVLQQRYELIGLLGEGGMGTVYMARDTRLHNRPCVVKKLRDDFYRDDERQQALQLFNREADVLSTLEHPNIVHILDYFEENGNYFLVMEYIEGMDLHNVLKQRQMPFTEEQVLPWARQICEVLEYLHNHEPPIIYRDLKPSNIMIDVKGRVKLVDFGIARHHDEDGDYTHVVSPGYSPPEQYRGYADRRSDIYALGATLHYLLTGHDPIALHTSCPRDVSDDVSLRTSAVIEKATQQDPDDRYSTARALIAALVPAVQETLPLPVAETKRNDMLVIGVVLVLAGVGLIGYFKLSEMLAAKQEQITAKDQELSKAQQEQEKLNAKLKGLSRAVEAQDKAIVEWHEISKKANSQLAKPTGDIAAQSATELQMTDPEGLVDP